MFRVELFIEEIEFGLGRPVEKLELNTFRSNVGFGENNVNT